MANRKHPLTICENCPLVERPFVPSHKVATPVLACVGEAPGRTEVIKKQPFVGPSGDTLWRTLALFGVSKDSVTTLNTVSCLPSAAQKPPPEAIECCRPRLRQEIDELPEETLVVGLGNVPKDALSPHAQGGVTTVRGLWYTLASIGSKRLATYLVHPAGVLRDPSRHGKDFMDGMRRALAGPPNVFADDIKHQVLRDRGEVKRVCERLAHEPVMTYDLETDQVNWRKDRILCLGIAWSPTKAVVIPGSLLYGAGKPYVGALLENREILWVGHNAKFDDKFLIYQLGIRSQVSFDTMIAHYVLDERPGTHALKKLVQQMFGVPDYELSLVQKHLRNRNDWYSKVPLKNLCRYCALDVGFTFRLFEEFDKALRAQGKYERPFKELLMQAARMFVDVEMHGMAVDRKRLDEELDAFGNDQEELQSKLRRVAKLQGYNPRSFPQTSKIIYDRFKMPVVTGRGVKARSTNKGAITALLAHPRVRGRKDCVEFLKALKKHRRVAKLRSSYLANLISKDMLTTEGRVHANFLIHGTEVGRLSVRNPALQTIPRTNDKEVSEYGTRIKSIYVASPGHKIMHADASQAELRAAAVLSKEPFLLDVYKDDRDLHTEVAIVMFGSEFSKIERVYCKMFNFAYVYGGTANSFATDAGLPIQEARNFVKRYDANMPQFAQYKRDQLAFMRSHGYVESLFGRRRRFPFINQMNFDEVRKASVHMPVASLASDITLMGAIHLHKLLPKGAYIILLVHDSILLEVRDDLIEVVAPLVKGMMEDVAQKYMPEVPWRVDVEVGDSWASVEKVEV